jgi:hypothetical protein
MAALYRTPLASTLLCQQKAFEVEQTELGQFVALQHLVALCYQNMGTCAIRSLPIQHMTRTARTLHYRHCLCAVYRRARTRAAQATTALSTVGSDDTL